MKNFFAYKIGALSIQQYIYLFARFGLGTVFFLASISKIPHIAEFQANVGAYHMLPIGILHYFAFIIAYIELFIAIYLFLGLFEKITAAVTFALIIVFMIAIAYALITNQPVSGCGCFSQASNADKISWWDEVRDSIFLACAIIVFFAPQKPFSIDSLLKK